MSQSSLKERGNWWVTQAQNDYDWAKNTLDGKFYAQACFISQQVAEKALKGLFYLLGKEPPKTHSVAKLAKDLKINGDLLAKCNRLDQYYITPRYPDAIPEGAPFEIFDKEQASQAIEFADQILQFVIKNS